jgi:hypothetical protein
MKTNLLTSKAYIMQDQKNKQKHPDTQQHKNQNSGNTGGMNMPGKDKNTHKTQKSSGSMDSDEEPVTESDFNPDKRIEIDDNPDETKRKIPNMKK